MSGLVIGLTGGIAAGKSLAAETFASLGAPVLDADRVAREAVAPGSEALQQIATVFGGEYLRADGGLDRRRMRERVFADPDARRRLEAITHPLIRDRLAAWKDAQTAPYCVLAVPILIEMGLAGMVHRVLVVDTPPELQLRRLLDRDGIDETLARQMLAAQLPGPERLAHAHDVVRNDGSPDTLRAAIAQLHAFYMELAHTGRRNAPGRHLP
jgi:dephospho-CoA kinase